MRFDCGKGLAGKGNPQPGICANFCYASDCQRKAGMSLRPENGYRAVEHYANLNYRPGLQPDNRKASGYDFI